MNEYNYISLTFIILITIWTIYSDANKITKFKTLFTNKKWFVHFIVLFLFTLWNLLFSSKGSKELIATKRAFTAFIIALFSSLDLTIAPFWIIWVLSFYFESWI